MRAELGAAYKTLLSSEINSVVNFSLQLTRSCLVVGHPCHVQLWCNYSSTANAKKVAITGGPILGDNTTDAVGGVRRYVIGAFVADGSTQIIKMKGVPGTALEHTEFGLITIPLINAFRSATVPEPATLGLIAFSATALLLLLRRR